MIAHPVVQIAMHHIVTECWPLKRTIFPALGTVFRVNVDFYGHLLVSGHLESSINSCRILPRVKTELQGLFAGLWGNLLNPP